MGRRMSRSRSKPGLTVDQSSQAEDGPLRRWSWQYPCAINLRFPEAHERLLRPRRSAPVVMKCRERFRTTSRRARPRLLRVVATASVDEKPAFEVVIIRGLRRGEERETAIV